MLNFCGFIQVYVFTTNHHLNHNDVPQETQRKKSLVTQYSLIEGKCERVN